MPDTTVEQTNAGIVTRAMVERLVSSARESLTGPLKVVMHPLTPVVARDFVGDWARAITFDPECPFGTVYVMEDT